MVQDYDPTYTARSRGQSPFAAQDAEARAALEKMPPAAPPPPRPPATVWDRLQGLLTRKRVDARTRYLQLLEKSELQGLELSEREIADLSAAVEEAGITAEQNQKHRALIQRMREKEAAATREARLQEAVTSLTVKIMAIDTEIQKLEDRKAPLVGSLQQSRFSLQQANLARSGLEGTREQIQLLFAGRS